VPPGLDKTALGEWLAAFHPPEAVRTIVDQVTRDEFVRRLADPDIVSQVDANPLVRVVALVEPAALLRWAASAAEPLERTTAAQFPCYPQPKPMTPEAPSRRPDASGRVRAPAPPGKALSRPGPPAAFRHHARVRKEEEGRLRMSNGEDADRTADRRTRVDHRVPRELAISGEMRNASSRSVFSAAIHWCGPLPPANPASSRSLPVAANRPAQLG
jgi:hypothetical protein